ncbi:TPA: restriction endonuclease subunit S [Klebsiella quasipneumoniae subsp. quasipneumoniae]|nr:restriction endonuclease subunit S [Klebsiella quasipneumoniae subsp. quasipneumoniae]HCI6779507.1 restriction endonuclease subunit S [Klebsiella quasipneumoniae subsp. quasipneumoniae]
MAKYKAYPEYKDSGVEWLGELPEHWTTLAIKHVAQLNPSKSCISIEKMKGMCSFIPMEKLKFNSLSLDEIKYVPDVYNGYTYFENEDILIAKVTPCFENKNMVVAHDLHNGIGFGSSEIYVLRCNDIIKNDFLFYRLQEDNFMFIAEGAMTGAGGLKRVPSEVLNNFKFGLPSKKEQSIIVAFLDHETAKIDNLIEKQQQLIELLKEKRQAVISHAVTKGLNPDVPMKDSGVEWLGEVPSHWQALPTKRLFRLVAEPAEINNDYELLSVYTAIGVAPRKDLEPKGNKASTTDGYWKVRQGDIIVNKLLAWMGAVGFSNYDGVTSPAYDILRKVKDINPKFYHYLFRLELTQREFKRWSRGIMEMRLRLYFEELGRIIMPVPPRQEQDVIVEEIEKIEYQYSQLENIASHQIDLLQERRTALISAAVTGKIDVRDWIAPDTQDVEESQEATA